MLNPPVAKRLNNVEAVLHSLSEPRRDGAAECHGASYTADRFEVCAERNTARPRSAAVLKHPGYRPTMRVSQGNPRPAALVPSAARSDYVRPGGRPLPGKCRAIPKINMAAPASNSSRSRMANWTGAFDAENLLTTCKSACSDSPSCSACAQKHGPTAGRPAAIPGPQCERRMLRLDYSVPNLLIEHSMQHPPIPRRVYPARRERHHNAILSRMFQWNRCAGIRSASESARVSGAS